MSSVDRIFLIPCACSARVAVTAGQAGDTIACPACGQPVAIPRLRDLASFASPPASSAVAQRTGWDAARGLVFAGALTAILGAILATSLTRIGGLFFRQPASVAAIRAAVRSAPVGDVHAAWKASSTMGVHRPPTEEELRLQQFAKTSSGIETVGWGLACIGGVIAIAGGLLIASAGGKKKAAS
ncbi:MAG: hypothetical protein ACR2IT_07685 [Pirellulales bacterium]